MFDWLLHTTGGPNDPGRPLSVTLSVGAFLLLVWLVRRVFTHTIPRLAEDFKSSLAAQRKDFKTELRLQRGDFLGMLKSLQGTPAKGKRKS